MPLKVMLTEQSKRDLLPVPRSPRPGDAGYDLHMPEAGSVGPGQQVKINMGLCLEIPTGYVGFLRERSSSADIRIYAHAGTIDAAYRGELIAVLENGGDLNVTWARHERLVQLVVVPCYTEAVEAVDHLSPSPRGTGGFGSTGH